MGVTPTGQATESKTDTGSGTADDHYIAINGDLLYAGTPAGDAPTSQVPCGGARPQHPRGSSGSSCPQG